MVLQRDYDVACGEKERAKMEERFEEAAALVKRIKEMEVELGRLKKEQATWRQGPYYRCLMLLIHTGGVS
jgi:hypothetical protein